MEAKDAREGGGGWSGCGGGGVDGHLFIWAEELEGRVGWGGMGWCGDFVRWRLGFE